MRVFYTGNLGSFNYDTNEFRVIEEGNLPDKSLRYIGSETDGSKIQIPNGLVDGHSMFLCGKITSLPKLPKSLLRCDYMFQECNCLRNVDVKFPDGIESMRYMFSYCKNLTTFSSTLPKNLEICSSMFMGCENLKVGPKRLPNHVKDVSLMFNECSSLLDTVENLPQSLHSIERMYLHCKSLRNIRFPMEDVLKLSKHMRFNLFAYCPEIRYTLWKMGRPLFDFYRENFIESYNSVYTGYYLLRDMQTKKPLIAPLSFPNYISIEANFKEIFIK